MKKTDSSLVKLQPTLCCRSCSSTGSLVTGMLAGDWEGMFTRRWGTAPRAEAQRFLSVLFLLSFARIIDLGTVADRLMTLGAAH